MPPCFDYTTENGENQREKIHPIIYQHSKKLGV